MCVCVCVCMRVVFEKDVSLELNVHNGEEGGGRGAWGTGKLQRSSRVRESRVRASRNQCMGACVSRVAYA